MCRCIGIRILFSVCYLARCYIIYNLKALSYQKYSTKVYVSWAPT